MSCNSIAPFLNNCDAIFSYNEVTNKNPQKIHYKAIMNLKFRISNSLYQGLTIMIITNNKRYIKVNKYKTLLRKENENNFNENIEYKEKLIEYEKDYKKFNLY